MNLASVRIEVEEVEAGKKYKGKVSLEKHEFPYSVEFHENLEAYLHFPYPIQMDDIGDAFDLEVFSQNGDVFPFEGYDRAFFEETAVGKAVCFYERERRKAVTGGEPVKKATSNLSMPMNEYLDDLIERSKRINGKKD